MMRTFAIASLAAAQAFAQYEWDDLWIKIDGYSEIKYFSLGPTSQVDTTGRQFSVPANNAVFMKRSKDDASINNMWKAYLRGGSI